jgi:predicted RNase H-like HicB family nuclease
MSLQRTIHAYIRRGDESGYIAACPRVGAFTQAETLDELARNIREAVSLALDGEDLASLGLTEKPVIMATFELSIYS